MTGTKVSKKTFEKGESIQDDADGRRGKKGPGEFRSVNLLVPSARAKNKSPGQGNGGLTEGTHILGAKF